MAVASAQAYESLRPAPRRRPTTEEIDDGWTLDDEGSTGAGPAPTQTVSPAPAAEAGWALAAEPLTRADDLRVDLNRATLDELRAVPGVGRRKAEALLRHRERRGPFRRLEDVAKVHGFGPRLVRRLATHCRAG